MRYLACFLLLLAACRATTCSKTMREPKPPTVHSVSAEIGDRVYLHLEEDPPVAGTDGTVSAMLPGPFPGRIVHADLAGNSDGAVVEGILASDAPLRFVRAGEIIKAESFDGSVVYDLPDSVEVSPPVLPDLNCCHWQEGTLWRAAPGAIGAGLLRTATSPLGDWSVIDWYRPGAIEPVWRLQLTEGLTRVNAAAVSPAADQIVVVLVADGGVSVARALSPRDGRTLWTTPLDSPAAEWRGRTGRMAYSFDGARFVVVTQDPGRCGSCSALQVFDSRTGKRLHRVQIKTILSPESSTVGLNGDAVWIFEHITPMQGHRADRPERCQYELHDLSSGAMRSGDKAAQVWGIPACRTWALLPRFGTDGVVGIQRSGPAGFDVLVADDAP